MVPMAIIIVLMTSLLTNTGLLLMHSFVIKISKYHVRKANTYFVKVLLRYIHPPTLDPLGSRFNWALANSKKER